MTPDQQAISLQSAEKRYHYFLQEVCRHGEIWILTDNYGCVMLTTEDEDCVPVWPAAEYAQQWATGEWQDCTPQAISLKDWHSRWTQGLEDDDMSIVVFPNEEAEGLIVSPDELDFELEKHAKK